jgi:hypothetical protein
MELSADRRVTAFLDDRVIARGELEAVAKAAHAVATRHPLVLDDVTGRTVDLDLRGTKADVLARLAPPKNTAPPVRGRPKLGVTAPEITLLPRHWEWLASQPGGASAAIRRLVEQARKSEGDGAETRQAQERVYRAMTTLCGDRPGYEEAIRALFAGQREPFARPVATWPADVRDFLHDLLGWRAA